MDINTFIRKYRKAESITLPHVVCCDGFKMSVQVGQGLYSEPNVIADFYESVEVGYPSEIVPELKAFDQGDDVFPFVPCTVIDEIIEKHGGINVEHSLVTSLRKGN
tara:strand:- start:271 stop:588 length:318 start_codon:yes stop_codon:yes gene_type:complete